MNKKQFVIIVPIIIASFIGGAFASASAPISSIVGIFVTNWPHTQNVTVTSFPQNEVTVVFNSNVTANGFFELPLTAISQFRTFAVSASQKQANNNVWFLQEFSLTNLLDPRTVPGIQSVASASTSAGVVPGITGPQPITAPFLDIYIGGGPSLSPLTVSVFLQH